jgi:hypothetical protein
MSLRDRAVLLAATLLLSASVVPAHADGPAPAVSDVNGKISSEGGVTGFGGDSSGVGVVKGSLTSPFGHAFGFQLDGMAGTAFNAGFGGGTAHLFWRDPAIGLFGPIASVEGGSGIRLGWYGAEAELYAGLLTFGAWGGYHEAVDNRFALSASSGSYGGSLTIYPIPDLALSLGATSEFSHVTGTGVLEFQPDLFAHHNVSFYINGGVGEDASYSITTGVRFYLGPDKPLIRRHREDDPALLANLESMEMWAQDTTAMAGYHSGATANLP